MKALYTNVARALMAEGIDTAFGVPGIHNLDAYQAFVNCGFSIFAARHEQSAAFMADGYARSSGKTAVCLVIDGPGFLNAATGISQARADSVPMVVVSPYQSSVAAGRLHELPGQVRIAREITKATLPLSSQCSFDTISTTVAKCLSQGRPGPISIQVPSELDHKSPEFLSVEEDERTSEASGENHLQEAIDLLDGATSPLVIVGGGAISARHHLRTLIELLDAPLLNTVNAKGILSSRHPLFVGGSPSLPCVQEAISDADVVLAIGTELGETDFDFLMNEYQCTFNNLVRIDIDRNQLFVNAEPTVGICDDAVNALPRLKVTARSRNGKERAAFLRARIHASEHYHEDYAAVLETLKLRADVLIGDSTQPTYFASWMYEPEAPRAYFHSATGFGTLGYAIPAAIGAKIADKTRSVICLIGDGGAQFTLPELLTASQYALNIPFIVWNNEGYEEIEKAATVASNIQLFDAVKPPELEAVAAAFKCHYRNPKNLKDFDLALEEVIESSCPMLIELNQSDFIQHQQTNWYS